ncbi:MAG: hypothetical protein JWP97_1841 [Labilithrix sp.]|nr:hypothetical protein [Labilithrix sp.]
MAREGHSPAPIVGRDAPSATSAEEEAPAPLITRVGTVVGGGVLAAITSALPAELRIGDGGSVVRAFEQWLALAALVTPLAIVMVAVLRRARVGLRIVAGERAPLYAAAALWWAVIELGVLSVFGAVLRAKTHHHGLAGVTFAMLALISGLGVALVALRGIRMLVRMPPQNHVAALGVVTVTTFIVVTLVGLRTSRAEGLHTAAALVDLLALVVASVLASSRPMSRWRPLGLGGIPIAAGILLLGLATVRSEPDLSGILNEGAPVQAFLLSLLGP